MRQGQVLTAALLAAILWLACPAIAEVPQMISYQGRLTDNSGDPITGSHALTVTIYDGGGVSKWTETHPDVSVDNGLFAVILGSQSALPDSVFNGEDRYLGVSIDADDEIIPRTLMTASPGSAYSRLLVGDISTGPGILRMKSVADDSAIVLMAMDGFNVVKLHPPDPCVPPDPCEPALELVAEPDNHIIRVHPPEPCVPPEPCTPALELIADAEIHSMKVYPPDPCTPDPCDPALEINSETNANTLTLKGKNPTNEENITSVTMSTGVAEKGIIVIDTKPGDVGNTDSVSVKMGLDTDENGIIVIDTKPGDGESGTSVKMSTGVAEKGIIVIDTKPGDVGGTDSVSVKMGLDTDENGIIVIDTKPGGDAGSSSVKLSTGLNETGMIIIDSKPADPTGDSVAVSMQTSSALAELTLFHGSSVDEADIALRTSSTGASIGINTNSPAEELYVIGDITATGAITELSSLKYKANINQIDNALDQVVDLRAVSFNWRIEDYPEMNFSEEKQIGLVAEEVETVIPELVHSDNNGEKSVDYSKLTAVLIEAVKELKLENEELRKRLDLLEDR